MLIAIFGSPNMFLYFVKIEFWKKWLFFFFSGLFSLIFLFILLFDLHVHLMGCHFSTFAYSDALHGIPSHSARKWTRLCPISVHVQQRVHLSSLSSSLLFYLFVFSKSQRRVNPTIYLLFRFLGSVRPWSQGSWSWLSPQKGLFSDPFLGLLDWALEYWPKGEKVW